MRPLAEDAADETRKHPPGPLPRTRARRRRTWLRPPPRNGPACRCARPAARVWHRARSDRTPPVVFEYTGKRGVPPPPVARSRANASHAPCTSGLWNAQATESAAPRCLPRAGARRLRSLHGVGPEMTDCSGEFSLAITTPASPVEMRRLTVAGSPRDGRHVPGSCACAVDSRMRRPRARTDEERRLGSAPATHSATSSP
jgi:hypothetical protein